MKKFSPGLWPTVMTVPAVLIMLSLSIWQLDRYTWKIDLIETLEHQLSTAAVAMPVGDFDVEEWAYRRVSLSGEFQHDKEIHLFSHAAKGHQGFQIITPLVRSDDGSIILVNRGWVPKDKKDPASRLEGQLSGIQVMEGIVRKPWTKSWTYMPDNNPDTNVWLYGELDQMAGHLNLDVAPVFVELEKADIPGGLPLGGQTRMSVPNNHIEYFFTWAGLAVAMIIIYGLFGIKRARKLQG